mgnify:CR=1 FL=1
MERRADHAEVEGRKGGEGEVESVDEYYLR